MFFRIRSLLSRGANRPGGKSGRPLRFRPAVEPLEDRSLLSIYVTPPTWNEIGPRPITQSQENVPPDSSVVGAIQSIAINPQNQSQIYVGSVNGGIWRTDNADPQHPDAISWTPLTDQQPDLSIGPIAFSPLDPTGKTLFAGMGTFSSSSEGGFPDGILRTTDGGNTWGAFGNDYHSYLGETIKAILPTEINLDTTSGTQEVVLVGGLGDSTYLGGLFQSNDNGQTFTFLSGANGLPVGDNTQLIADPGNPYRFYAGIKDQGIFRGDFDPNTQVITWTAVNNGLKGIGTADNVQVTAWAHNYLYALLSGPQQGAYVSANGGDTWNALATPPGPFTYQRINGPGNTIVADPTYTNEVYIATYGVDPFGEPFIYRYNLNNNTWVSIAGQGNTLSGTYPHADFRDLAIITGRAGGQPTSTLVAACDGGVFFLPNPQDATNNDWRSFNGSGSNGLGTAEFFSIAYDNKFGVAFGGTQDNGTDVQSAPGSLVWSHFIDGDGQAVAVDTTTLAGQGESIRYGSSGSLSGFSRFVFDSPTDMVSQMPLFPDTGPPEGFIPQGFTQLQLDAVATSASGFSQRLVIGGRGTHPVYEADNAGVAGSPDAIHWKAVPTAAGFGTVTALAYGGRALNTDDPDVLYAGSNGQVFVRVAAGDTLQPTPAQFPGGYVQDIVLDPNNFANAFVISTNGVWNSPDLGNHWYDLTGNIHLIDYLTSNSLQTVQFVQRPSDGLAALLVGGLGGVFVMRTDNPGVWSSFGTGLPNTITADLAYDSTDDMLVAGTLGRGVWEVPHVSNALFGPPSVKPKAGTPGDYQITEGETLQLHANANDTDGNTLTYQWDINGDGDYSDAVGANPIIPWSMASKLLADSGTYNVSYQVSDGSSTVTSPSGTLTVTDTAPTATFSASASQVNEGQSVTFSFSNQSDSPADPNPTFTYAYDVGNTGTPGPVTSNPSLTVTAQNDPSLTVVGYIYDQDNLYTTYQATVTVNNIDVIATGYAQGHPPMVTVMDSETLQVKTSFLAYAANFTGGVHVAVGDVDGDGVPDVITAPGAGGKLSKGTLDINAYDGGHNWQLDGVFQKLRPFGDKFTGGYNIACADINQDGYADLIVAPAGGFKPEVKVYNSNDSSVLYDLMPFPNKAAYRSGVRVATGDVNGDGVPDIICSAGTGKYASVVVIDGSTGQPLANSPYGQGFNPFANYARHKSGINVAAGVINGQTDVIVSLMSGVSIVTVLSGADGSVVNQVTPVESGYKAGLQIAVTNAPVDGHALIIVGTLKTRKLSPNVQILDGATLNVVGDFSADPNLVFKGGVYVAGGR